MTMTRGRCPLLPTYRPILRGSRWSTYRLWTAVENAYLRGLWGDPARRGRRVELAALVLDRTPTAVAWHAHRLGLGRRTDVFGSNHE